MNLDELLGLVRDKRYFVLHAPRQTGKTSALLALCDLLNSSAGAWPIRGRWCAGHRLGHVTLANSVKGGESTPPLRDPGILVRTIMMDAPPRLGLRIVTPDDHTDIDIEPLQGLWTQAQYFQLTDHARLLIEFTDGRLEVPPIPTDRHQAISQFLFLALSPVVRALGGKVRYAPLRLRIRDGKFREPDLLLVRDANDPRRRNDYWRGADLVMEIVSPDDPERDTHVKRRDYAEARIPEYWIVNPMDETITVLTLAGDAYAEHGVFGSDQQADSVCLHGFAVAVADVFGAA